MLFIIVERFRGESLKAVGERFNREGRMLPEGVTYLMSWMEPAGACCYQVMEAPDRKSIDVWISRWDDLVDFEITPVVTSAEFWAATGRGV